MAREDAVTLIININGELYAIAMVEFARGSTESIAGYGQLYGCPIMVRRSERVRDMFYANVAHNATPAQVERLNFKLHDTGDKVIEQIEQAIGKAVPARV